MRCFVATAFLILVSCHVYSLIWCCRFGRIDILINGAAGNFLALVENLSYNAFKTVIDIDTIGTFNVTKAVFTKVCNEYHRCTLSMRIRARRP